MKREEIIKALECCDAPKMMCNECPIQDECESNPLDAVLARHALALIRELTAENEKLTINMNAYGLTVKRLSEENENLRAHKKMLEELRERDLRYMDMFLEASGAKKVMADTRAATAREMQENLKRKSEIVYGDRAVCVELIDQIAEKMIGETK